MKTREVAAIENGIVIDHLPSDKVLKIVEMLSLDPERCVTLGINLDSHKIGKKGIIKISGRNLSEQEMNKIAVLAPEITVNKVEDYAIVKKKKITLREIEPNTVRCHNPNCITNKEKVLTKFHILTKEPLKLRCHYCERSMRKEEIQIITS